MRLFTALPLPDTLRQELTQYSFGLVGVRWIQAHQLHITLNFIGSVDANDLPLLIHELSTLQFEPFSIQIKGAELLPQHEPHKILYAQVIPHPGLIDLQKKLEKRITECGHSLERRKYFPHVTLARLGHFRTHEIGAYLAQRSLYESKSFEVESFNLYSSELHKDGVEYTLEEEFSAYN